MKFLTPDWPAPKNVKAHTTLRTSWGAHKPHHQKNEGNFTAQYPNYLAEDNDIMSLLDLPTHPIWLKQIHGTTVIEATPTNREKNADASFANKPNHVCAVLTADCLPVLICNKQGTRVAAAHAGWRGLAGGIIETTVEKLQQKPNDLLVWLGPAIGPQKFEVGRDVYEAFINKQPESASAFNPHKEEKWLANLYHLAKLRLLQLGITETHIFGGNYCTFTQDDLFFSFRRDKGHQGRMASLIWFDAK